MHNPWSPLELVLAWHNSNKADATHEKYGFMEALLVEFVRLCAYSLVTPVWQSQLQLWHFSVAVGSRPP